MSNFGEIKSIYNQILTEGVVEKNNTKKRLFKKYISLLKEDKKLKDQFDVYYNIENKVESDGWKAVEFVNESLSILNKYSTSDIIKSNSKILNLLGENKVDLKLDTSKKELYENITILITTKKTSKTIDTIVEAKAKIVDYILNNEKSTNEVDGYGLPNSVLSEIAVGKFNDTYGDLSESEPNVIKLVIEGNDSDKSNFYQETIKDCLTMVNDKLTESTIEVKEKLLSVKENLLNRVYNPDTFVSDVSKVLELKSLLSNNE